MTGRTHALLGAVTWVVVAGEAVPGAPSSGEIAFGAVICAGRALLPDLDHVGSRASRAGGVATRALAVGVRTAAGGHRGATHSAVAVLALWLGLTAVADRMLVPDARWIADAVAAGALSHLVADGLTAGGVPLLWPLTRRRLGVPLARTGGSVDRLVGLACLALLAVVAIRSVWPALL
ncbi:metal-dependent hydrolase [Euzebya sp.]|uniref:metal-dependent hydrolase n=1 Tax=Euzebya sp. TaxID=1971409 RepID=UPI003518FB30